MRSLVLNTVPAALYVLCLCYDKKKKKTCMCNASLTFSNTYNIHFSKIKRNIWPVVKENYIHSCEFPICQCDLYFIFFFVSFRFNSFFLLDLYRLLKVSSCVYGNRPSPRCFWNFPRGNRLRAVFLLQHCFLSPIVSSLRPHPSTVQSCVFQ